jgi:predicted  nucleic acid-binding Zn-ribbon protein
MDRILSNLNPLTEYAILFISVIGIFFQLRWTRRGGTLGPTLLTTLGIFFCFLGIALGLSDFDPNDVRSSVPHLLQGIRTSFWSSVTGIGWALLIKIRLVMFGEPPIATTTSGEGATIDDLAAELVRLNAGIGGEAGSSLLGEIRISREQTSDRLERLSSALDTHAQRTSDAATQSFTKALSAVVSDFNAGLMSQFGENFKALNDAVERLAGWIAQYESQLESAMVREAESARALSDASARYVDMIDKSAVFVQTASALQTLLTTLTDERVRLETELKAFVALVDKASTGLPRLEEHIVQMTEQIARGVQTNQEAMGAVLKSSWQSIQVHNQSLSAMLAKSMDSADREVANHSRHLSDNGKPKVPA